jgi:DNA-binding NarL/FixJ family response regulator
MAQHSPSGKRRAVIVEDEFLIAVDLETILRGLGFDVCGLASNPSEAISLATSNRPDVVLMDVYLDEGCQGIKAARWLREACEIPVLFVTAHNDGPTVGRIRKLVPGAPVLPKPVTREGLADPMAVTILSRDPDPRTAIMQARVSEAVHPRECRPCQHLIVS